MTEQQPLIWSTVSVTVDSLILYDKNPRKISETKKKKLIESLSEFGLVEIPVIDLDSTVIAGNQRVTALQLAGRSSEIIDVRKPNRKLTEKEKKKYVLISNTHSGDFDFDLIEQDFAEIDLSDLGIELPAGFYNSKEVVEVEPEEPKDKTDIQRGDLYQIGKHRLLCGDSTSADDVAKLLDGQHPQLMITDPPYGVSYVPNWRNEYCLTHGIGVANRQTGEVQNDNRIDWTEAYSLFTGDVAYVYHAGKYSHTVAQNLTDCGFEVVSQIIWAKQHFVFSRGDYHWKHEPCLYVVRKGKNHNWIGDRKQTTVWEIKNNNSFGNSDKELQTNHGTQKPIETFAKPIRNHSGDIYDPFGGSGTSMVASEQLNRKSFLLEIDPIYCQAIIDRMKKLNPNIEIKKL